MVNSVLRFKEYDIAGNLLRAYYDAGGKLIFVLDSTIDDRKPNVLLVINPVSDRKWDDILSNDYGVDLETVRPKKNNKYQKLDIEYDGLAEYGALISAYENGDDLTGVLSALESFRDASVRRSAAERLSVAESNAEKARETILKTKDSIDEQQIKLRQLRTKLSQQKKQVGREPTKQSASKILRTEAQIDATNEKLRRAKKRLDNAQRRLIIADEDAEIARGILAQEPVVNKKVIMPGRSVAVNTPEHTNIVVLKSEENADVNANAASQNSLNEQKADIMAEDKNNEEVKPLFDTDPEILDEEIAFKPIEFGVSSQIKADEPINDDKEIYENVVEDVPLSFTPPVENVVQEPITVKPVTPGEYTNKETEPVLNTIRSVEAHDETPAKVDAEFNEGVQSEVKDVQPVIQNTEKNMVRPVPPAATLSESVARPVSPITGMSMPTNPAPRKPTLIYYVMLVLLIGLSIFTLWLYQRNTGDKMPDLTTTISTAEDTVAVSNTEESVDSPFIPEVEYVSVTETEPVVEPEPVIETFVEPAVVEPQPIIQEEQEPVAFESEPVAEPEPVTMVNVVEEQADIIAEDVKNTIPTEEEILASKPSYNVSQNEKMFVASSDYNTDSYYDINEEPVNVPMCPDGMAPDSNGCCAGEVYTNMGNMGFNCCPQGGGDCFPPLY